MNCVVDYIRLNKKSSLLVLIALVCLMLVGVALAGFWFGLTSIFVLYFLVGLYVFSTIEPKEWEASIIFVLYFAAAALLIIYFSFISMANAKYFHGDGSTMSLITKWQHFYFSASMFTSLGFSNFTPVSQQAQIFAVAQSLLGSAHGVTFILVMLGRKKWLGQPEKPVVPGLDGSQSIGLKVAQIALTLRIVVVLLVLNFIALLVLALR
jgi:hypothetical protein